MSASKKIGIILGLCLCLPLFGVNAMAVPESRLLLQKIEMLQQEVSELRGRIELEEHAISQIKKQETAETIVPVEKPVEKNAMAVSTNTEKEKYDEAFLLVSQNQYDEALTAFQTYLTNFPSGDYAGHANYWMGEIYFLQWQANKEKITVLDNATQAFLKITAHEQNPKALDALLKLGLIEIAKKNPVAARKYLTELRERAPHSTAPELHRRIRKIKLN